MPTAKTTEAAFSPEDGGIILGRLRERLSRHWWLFLLRGILAILAGVLALVMPGEAIVVSMLFFGGYMAADGLISIIAAIRGGGAAPRWWLALIGVVGILAGVAVAFWPGLAAMTILAFIAFWAIAGGAAQIIGGILLRREIDYEWRLVGAGALSVVFGLALLWQPMAGTLAVVYTVGLFTIVYGLLMLWFAFRLRRRHVAS